MHFEAFFLSAGGKRGDWDKMAKFFLQNGDFFCKNTGIFLNIVLYFI